MQERVDGLIKGREPSPLTRGGQRRRQLPKWEQNAEAEWRRFLERLRAVRVLDPACGSGNFLYVTLRLLKDLEQEAIRWGAERLRITGEFPRVDPHNVLGIEINPYARELAGVAIWIGHIQWMLDHGYGFPRDPVLQPLDNIELRDAILAHDEDGKPVPTTWPEAEFIVGNPPFLGSRRMRLSLGDSLVDDVVSLWRSEIPPASDLVCYWHEMARRQIENQSAVRAGLLATNSIRSASNRHVLRRIKRSGDIFFAWSDEPWIVEGADVRVSIVGQDDGSESIRMLDGKRVHEINSDLTFSIDVTQAENLVENSGLSSQGDIKGGPFEITGGIARSMLLKPTNVNRRTNADVLIPWMNAMDVTRRPRDMFIVDFGTEMDESTAAEYETPFKYIKDEVYQGAIENREKSRRDRWWLHQRPRREMRESLLPLSRFIATPRVSKHRLFVWLSGRILPDTRLVVIARDDDYTFGVLHSRVHEVWALRTGGFHGVGNDPQYTPTKSFETFPFPWPLNTPRCRAVAGTTRPPRRHRRGGA